MTPTLTLINGAPGTGKSTVARQWAEAHPLTVALDVDVVRGMLGAWQAREADAGILARKLALRMICAALDDGRDVLVPQLVARQAFLDDLAATARARHAAFVHVVLVAPAQTCVQRCAARGCGPQLADPTVDLQGMVEDSRSALEKVTDPAAVTIDAAGTVDETLTRFAAAMEFHRMC